MITVTNFYGTHLPLIKTETPNHFLVDTGLEYLYINVSANLTALDGAAANETYAGMTTSDMLDIHRALTNFEGRRDTRSPAWAGKLIANNCGFRTDPSWKKKATWLLNRLYRAKVIKIVRKKDGRRRIREFFAPTTSNDLEWIEMFHRAMAD